MNVTEYFKKEYMVYCRTVESLDAEGIALEEKLAEAIEESKKDAWKFTKGASKDSVAVKAVRALIAENEKKKTDLDNSHKITIEVIDDMRKEEKETAAFKRWLASDKVPKPAHLVEEDAAELAELHASCVILKRCPMVNNEKEGEGDEDSQWGRPLSAEERIQQLLHELLPQVKKNDTEAFKPSTSGRGTKAWNDFFDQCKDRAKARRAAAV